MSKRIKSRAESFPDWSARVRSTRFRAGFEEKFTFTWKKRRIDGSRLEIETNISVDDFNELWKIADRVITKERIKMSGYGVTWDIDFLYSGTDINDSHYLTIAEVEMPEGMDHPCAIPNFVKNNLLYLVPRDEDKQWVNPKLTDPQVVQKMLEYVLSRTENG